jgi:hypothetical protein
MILKSDIPIGNNTTVSVIAILSTGIGSGVLSLGLINLLLVEIISAILIRTVPDGVPGSTFTIIVNVATAPAGNVEISASTAYRRSG